MNNNQKTKTYLWILLIIVSISVGVFVMSKTSKTIKGSAKISLPTANLKSKISIEEAIKNRRSTRDYEDAPVTTQEVAQLLWAAQGITDPEN
jgi:hypothetical protein